ncbi:MAG: leucyl aminopeptidase family protein [Fibrobacterales bacterium]|nr:leucyl aminopeptidase family protein [Fibrobacterales bacterium]
MPAKKPAPALPLQFKTAVAGALPKDGVNVVFVRKGIFLFGVPDWDKETAARAKRAVAVGGSPLCEILPWGEGDLLLVGDPGQPGLDPKGDALRLMGHAAFLAAKKRGTTVRFWLPKASAAEAALLAEGIRYADYAFTAYKSEAETHAPIAVELLVGKNETDALKQMLARADKVFAGIKTARDLINTPGSDLTPEVYAAKVEELFRGTGVKVKVRRAADLAEEGFNGLLTVGRGSRNTPCMVTLEWSPRARKEDKRIGLVGKGLTFDSGGISIKPADRMWEMKSDMSGSASVVGAMLAVAALKVPVQVVGVLCMAENRPGENAVLPGDVFTAKNGKTVMVDNTDAEGRLALSDGLCEACALGCTHLVDTATLTGACVRALGPYITGLFCNDEEFARTIAISGACEGEKFWRLPLAAEYRDTLDDPVADMKNCGNTAGAITAALFLKEFVTEGTLWAHWDIAGPAFADKAWKYYGKGGTGWGVKTMVALAETLAGA